MRRTGLIALLYVVAFFCWYPLALSNYGPLEELLELTSFVEFATVVALLLSLRMPTAPPPYWWLLGLFAFSGLGVWYWQSNPDPTVAWRAVRWNILVPVVSYVAAWRVIRSRQEAELIVFALVAGQIFLATISLGAAAGLFGPPDSNEQSLVGEQTFRLANSYQIPFLGWLKLGGNWTVFFHCYTVPFLVARILLVRQGTWNGLFLLALTANIAAVLMAASRTSIIALFITSAVAIVISALGPRIPSRRPIRITALITIVVLFAIVLGTARSYFGDVVSARVTASIDLLTRADLSRLGDDDRDIRGTMYSQFVPTAMAAPLGAGFVESFAYLGGPDIGPHAQYLFLLLGTGLIGLLSWVAFLAKAALRLTRTAVRHDDPIRWVVIGCQGAIVSYLINCFMIHTYLVRGADMMLFLIVGLGMRVAVLSEVRTSAPSTSRQQQALMMTTLTDRTVVGQTVRTLPNSAEWLAHAPRTHRRTARER